LAKRKKVEVQEHMLHVMSNDPTSQKYDLLEMLLSGMYKNQIGYMDAMHKETGAIERLLVGLEPTPAGTFAAYPLARLLEPEEVSNYLAPDGQGGWDGRDSETVQ
jgi:hypothetical protein